MSTPEPVRSALVEALEDEYKARATYRKVIERFGEIRPFTNLLAAEQRHAEALERLCERYGVRRPRDVSRVATPKSLLAACRAGAEAEIENGALYDRLIAQTEGYPDVQRVFRRLQSASQERHLPAFQRCVAREMAAPGAGRGRAASAGGDGCGNGQRRRRRAGAGPGAVGSGAGGRGRGGGRGGNGPGRGGRGPGRGGRPR